MENPHKENKQNILMKIPLSCYIWEVGDGPQKKVHGDLSPIVLKDPANLLLANSRGPLGLAV